MGFGQIHKSTYNICTCNTKFIASILYMHVWHEVQGDAKIY